MALLNKNHIKSLVAVGSFDLQGKFVCDSTSFQVGFLVKKSDDPTKTLYQIFLVTNRHVFEGRKKVWLRLNADDGKTKTFEQDLFSPTGDSLWLAHPDAEVDLALLSVSVAALKENNIQQPFFISEEMFAYIKDFESVGIAPGDETFVVGFPMGIAGEDQNYPCVKAGMVSRFDGEIIKSKKAFIIDSSIFPGNSGGPVILKPTITALSDTKTVNQPYLLGVVRAYIPFIDTLYTHQTKPPTPISTTRENSGLSYCVPMDYVKEIYDKWLSDKKPVEPPQNSTSQEGVQEVLTPSSHE